jgi:hypothetical protein
MIPYDTVMIGCTTAGHPGTGARVMLLPLRWCHLQFPFDLRSHGTSLTSQLWWSTILDLQWITKLLTLLVRTLVDPAPRILTKGTLVSLPFISLAGDNMSYDIQTILCKLGIILPYHHILIHVHECRATLTRSTTWPSSVEQRAMSTGLVWYFLSS